MILDIAIDPDGTHLAAVNSKGRCYIWSLSGGKGDKPMKMQPHYKFNAHSRQTLKCKYSPDSSYVTYNLCNTCTIRILLGY